MDAISTHTQVDSYLDRLIFLPLTLKQYTIKAWVNNKQMIWQVKLVVHAMSLSDTHNTTFVNGILTLYAPAAGPKPIVLLFFSV